MKYTTAKLLHTILFLLFSSIYLWIIYLSWDDSLTSRLVVMVMVTLIVFQAKWAFIDGFKAVERKRVFDEKGFLTAVLKS